MYAVPVLLMVDAACAGPRGFETATGPALMGIYCQLATFVYQSRNTAVLIPALSQLCISFLALVDFQQLMR